MLILIMSIFLIGYILGPLLRGPNPDFRHRRPLLIPYYELMVFALAREAELCRNQCLELLSFRSCTNYRLSLLLNMIGCSVFRFGCP